MKKILIVRFSSFGDIIHVMSVLPALRKKIGDGQIHWLTRSDFENLLSYNPLVNKVIPFQKKDGLVGLIKLCLQLRKQKYDLIYDAHNNLRSLILRILMLFSGTKIIVRSKDRWKRFLLFKLRKNFFPKPFRAMKTFQGPLLQWDNSLDFASAQHHWNFTPEMQEKLESLIPFDRFITLAPSAAWEMKRWPLEHWKEVIALRPNDNFVVLGGPTDKFCDELVQIDPTRVVNLAGKISLMESSLAVKNSQGLVVADTGLLHVADILGVKTLALIGPTAFGFPTHEQVKVLEVDLPCRPCTKDGRGKCVQEVYQKCMVDITANTVAKAIEEHF